MWILASWGVLSLALGVAIPMEANEFRHQAARELDSGETSLAIYWSRSASRVRADHVHQLTTQSLESAANVENILAAARAMGVRADWRRFESRQGATAPIGDLASLLKTVDACLLPWGQPADGRAEANAVSNGWALAWIDQRSQRLCVLDPRGPPAILKTDPMKPEVVKRRWRPIAAGDSKAAWQALLLRGKPTRQLPTLGGHSRFQYRRKVEHVHRRIATLRKHAHDVDAQQASFHVLVEQPFVVAGDGSVQEMQRWTTGTVRWAVEKMKAKYFAKDPESVLEIWLFDGKASYERNVEKLFGSKPTTPYGYYSPRHQALVMNIQTGGGTLVHEILHPYMEANFPACPAWFNEGLASLYEQSTERQDEIHGLTNWRLAGLQRALSAGGAPTFKTLCNTTSKDFYADKSGVHYAAARYLCYFLQEERKLKRFYDRFLANRREDPSGYATLQEVLEERDMTAFEERWKAFVLNLRFP